MRGVRSQCVTTDSQSQHFTAQIEYSHRSIKKQFRFIIVIKLHSIEENQYLSRAKRIKLHIHFSTCELKDRRTEAIA